MSSVSPSVAHHHSKIINHKSKTSLLISSHVIHVLYCWNLLEAGASILNNKSINAFRQANWTSRSTAIRQKSKGGGSTDGRADSWTEEILILILIFAYCPFLLHEISAAAAAAAQKHCPADGKSFSRSPKIFVFTF
jgi:hypothetical protein